MLTVPVLDLVAFFCFVTAGKPDAGKVVRGAEGRFRTTQ